MTRQTCMDFGVIRFPGEVVHFLFLLLPAGIRIAGTDRGGQVVQVKDTFAVLFDCFAGRYPVKVQFVDIRRDYNAPVLQSGQHYGIIVRAHDDGGLHKQPVVGKAASYDRSKTEDCCQHKGQDPATETGFAYRPEHFLILPLLFFIFSPDLFREIGLHFFVLLPAFLAGQDVVFDKFQAFPACHPVQYRRHQVPDNGAFILFHDDPP